MNIVLTGATGFLGSVLARKLVAKGIQVFAITRTTSQTRRIDELRENPLFKTVTKEELAKTFEKNPIDAVIHVATCLGRNG